MSERLVIAKDVSSRYPEAVVMDTNAGNKVVYRSGLGFNKRGKAKCEQWLAQRPT